MIERDPVQFAPAVDGGPLARIARWEHRGWVCPYFMLILHTPVGAIRQQSYHNVRSAELFSDTEAAEDFSEQIVTAEFTRNFSECILYLEHLLSH